MKVTTTRGPGLHTPIALATVLLFAASTASAQAPAQAAASPSGSAEPNPYYLGVSQALTHDSNVSRSPGGPSDNYSSTSLLGGFDQPISRQRIYGNASVTLNKYFDQSQLNNTAYNVGGGLDWQTIGNLSGNVTFGLGRNLAAPAASGVTPGTDRNIADTQNYGATVRWGGPSILSVEGSVGYQKVDYSLPIYAASESTQDTGSLGVYYRPGTALRLGLAGRVTKTDSPQALTVVGSGPQGNTVKGKNIDFIVDYDLTGLVTTNARISYTKQTNSTIGSADFSGVTGNIAVSYRPTGKTTIYAYAARDAGFTTTAFTGYTVSFLNGFFPVLSPVNGLYENNQVTNSVGLNVSYLATGKITANASVRYARAKLVSTLVTSSSAQAAPDTTDVSKSAQLSANYAIARNWNLACAITHENRDVSGAIGYSYTVNTASCLGQYTWR